MSPRVAPEHKAKRRQEILAAAEIVFARKGYTASVMQDVIEQSGLSRGCVYQYFSSKEALMLGLLEDYDDKATALFERLLAEHPTSWEAVEALLDRFVRRAAGFREDFFLVFYEYFILRWRETAFVAFHEKRQSGKAPGLVRFLQAGVERGEFAPRVPLRAIADMLGNLVDGMNLSGLLLGAEGVDVEAQREVLRQTLHHLLGVKAPLR